PAYLAAHGAPAVPGDLKDHVCIRDTNLRGGIEWPLTSGEQIRRHRVSGRFRVDNAQVTRDLALAGEGLALCPDFLVEPNLRDGTLVSVMDRHRGPELDIQAVYLASRQLPRKVRVLIEHLARSF
ncbi:MAG: substrate binding domain-containing protein, partial [Pseudomonadota bacterium]